MEGPPFCSSALDTFHAALEMHSKGEATDAEWAAFTRSCAELAQAKYAMMALNFPWRPSMYAGQQHAWADTARTIETWATIAQSEVAAEAKQRAEWDAED